MTNLLSIIFRIFIIITLVCGIGCFAIEYQENINISSSSPCKWSKTEMRVMSFLYGTFIGLFLALIIGIIFISVKVYD